MLCFFAFLRSLYILSREICSMHTMKKIILSIFLLFFSILLCGYIVLILLFPRTVLLDLHHSIPAVEAISSFFWVIHDDELFDKASLEKKKIQDTIQWFLWRKSKQQVAIQETIGSSESERFFLKNIPEDGRLYSPVYTFVWQLSPWVKSLRLYYHHEKKQISKELLIDSFSEWDEYFSYEVGLHRDSMFAGDNSYVLEATYASWKKHTKRIQLTVQFERVVIGSTTLFVDPQYTANNIQEDIIRTAKDFDGNDTHFINYGCEIVSTKPWILVKNSIDYEVVPACLSFSLIKPYILLYSYESQLWWEYLFTIRSPEHGVLKRWFPLYYNYLGTVFYTMLFYDPLLDRLTSLKSRGDSLKYDLDLVLEHLPSATKELTISLLWGIQLEIATTKEKMILYLYKSWDLKTGLLHPGTRYQYFRKAIWDRRSKVSEWQVYTLPIRVFAPGDAKNPTFSFDFSLQNTTIQVADGIRRMQIPMENMLSTMQSFPIPTQWDCDTMRIGVYQDSFGDRYTRFPLRRSLLLVASWIPTNKAVFYHNNTKEAITPEQLFEGYLYQSIKHPNKYLDPWANTYAVAALDDRGRELCRKTITIQTE